MRLVEECLSHSPFLGDIDLFENIKFSQGEMAVLKTIEAFSDESKSIELWFNAFVCGAKPKVKTLNALHRFISPLVSTKLDLFNRIMGTLSKKPEVGMPHSTPQALFDGHDPSDLYWFCKKTLSGVFTKMASEHQGVQLSSAVSPCYSNSLVLACTWEYYRKYTAVIFGADAKQKHEFDFGHALTDTALKSLIHILRLDSQI